MNFVWRTRASTNPPTGNLINALLVSVCVNLLKGTSALSPILASVATAYFVRLPCAPLKARAEKRADGTFNQRAAAPHARR